MSSSNFFIMVSCCALSVGSVLLTSSCGGGGGGDGAEIAPVELEGLVLDAGGVQWTFKKGGNLDYALTTTNTGTLIDGFAMLWPDNLLGASYTYEVTGSRTGVATIVAVDGADWSRFISPGGGWITLPEDKGYPGATVDQGGGIDGGAFIGRIRPFEIQISFVFDSQSGPQITAVTAHIKFEGIYKFGKLYEDMHADGALPDVSLVKTDGNLPETGYDPDENLASPQPSTKTDGLFDGDTIELYGDVEAKLNFTRDGYPSGSQDLEAPNTEVGILQALWDSPSQADYSLVQIYGTDNVILTITNDTQGRDGVIVLQFQGIGEVGVYDTSDGESGTFQFIENL